MKYITSQDNEEIKEVKKLHTGKHRKEMGLFFFEGKVLTEDFLSKGYTPYRVFLREDMEGFLPESNSIRIVSEKVYSKITDEQSPQGILTVGRVQDLPVHYTEEEALCGILGEGALVCESMRDPGNVGTVIRTANAFNSTAVFTSDSADALSPKVIRGSMGGIFSSKVYIISSATLLAKHWVENGKNAYAAILNEESERLGDASVDRNGIFIIGNEGKGIKAETALECNKKIYIPMSEKAESLNAAVAAAVIMWEIRRNI